KKERYIKVIFEKMPDSLEAPNAKIIEKGEDVVTYKIAHKNLSDFLSYVTKEFDIVDVDILSVPLEEIISDIFKRSEN
ncbi:MAG: hypothetical protein Q7S39_12280, partial [Ignavibacteria bacterium]|nr:hypothetical protein [Ignavibacteria bacterium]